MPKFLRAIVVSATIVVTLVVAQSAGAAVKSLTDEEDFPFGKYEGSAVGDSGGDPIAVTVYVTGKDSSDVAFAVRADMLPATIDVEPSSMVWDPQKNAWEFTVSVNKFGLNGSGGGEVTFDRGNGVIFGAGEGSFQGNSGSGRGTVDMVSAGQTSTGAQIVEGFNSFVGGPPKAGPVKYPRKIGETSEEAQRKAEVKKDAKGIMKALFGDAPLGPFAFFIFILVVFIIMLALGLI